MVSQIRMSGHARFGPADGSADWRDDDLRQDIAVRFEVVGCERFLDLREVVRSELEGRPVRLVAPACRVPNDLCCGHLDMAADQVCHRPLRAPAGEWPIERTKAVQSKTYRRPG